MSENLTFYNPSVSLLSKLHMPLCGTVPICTREPFYAILLECDNLVFCTVMVKKSQYGLSILLLKLVGIVFMWLCIVLKARTSISFSPSQR